MTTIDDETEEQVANEEDDGEHVCEACGESFETESALERHVHDEGLVD